MNKRISLSVPHINGKEMDYINKAFESGWIVPLGANVDEFENSLALYTGMKRGVALSAGTAAIHLGLKYLGVTDGDEVFCSSSTFSASCNPIAYERATPIFIDSDESCNMSPIALRSAFEASSKRHKLPKAVIIVDLYGMPAKYDELLPICEEYGVPVFEDAAEALGSTYKRKKCGGFGELAALSFNGNKIITCSGGGMLLTNSDECAEKIKFWATQSREPAMHYQHEELGYNYRLSNVSAGIGLGQFETIDKFIELRRRNNRYYREKLKGYPLSFLEEIDGAFSNFWLSVALIDKSRNESHVGLIQWLKQADIETRPYWKPMHLQPVFRDCGYFYDEDKGDMSSDFFTRGLCLPSSTVLELEDLDRIIQTIKAYFDR